MYAMLMLAEQATKGKETLSFYTLPEYEEWAESINTSGWRIKYYKGLGTSTDKEAHEYFSNIARHRKSFVWNGEQETACIASVSHISSQHSVFATGF